MEVLTSYKPPKSRDALPYSTSQRAGSSSTPIFDRRSSLKSHSELALDHTVFLKLHGESSRAGVGVPHRSLKASVCPRTFAPLTPIIASPITTPTTSTPTVPLYLTNEKEGAKERLTALHNSSHHEQNYLTKGVRAPMPDFDEKATRVFDKSPTWTSTPPTPPPKPPRYRSTARRVSSDIPPSASLPALLNLHAYFTSNTPKRHASLPPMSLSKPLPPTPPLKSQGSNLPKQLFRSPEDSHRSGAMVPVSDSKRSSSKRIFHVHDGHSDGEEHGSDEPLSESPKEMFLEQQMKASENDWSKAKRQDDIRRYHALIELLMTEDGYLTDLRELVNVSTSRSIHRDQ